MPGWAKSKGIMQEVDWFQSRGLPVYLFGAKRLFTGKEWRALGG
jgi:hypothetical protein